MSSVDGLWNGKKIGRALPAAEDMGSMKLPLYLSKIVHLIENGRRVPAA